MKRLQSICSRGEFLPVACAYTYDGHVDPTYSGICGSLLEALFANKQKQKLLENLSMSGGICEEKSELMFRFEGLGRSEEGILDTFPVVATAFCMVLLSVKALASNRSAAQA
eukprot:g42452.t1